MYNRWWVSPGKEIIPVSGTTHIDEIIRNPDRFGFTKAEIEEAYSRHNEPIGLEGQAREEIMKKAMDDGWIRARDGKNGLYMETGNLKRYKNVVYDAVYTFLEKGLVHQYDPVTVVDYRSGDILRGESSKEVLRQVYAKNLKKLNIVKK